MNVNRVITVKTARTDAVIIATYSKDVTGLQVIVTEGANPAGTP